MRVVVVILALAVAMGAGVIVGASTAGAPEPRQLSAARVAAPSVDAGPLDELGMALARERDAREALAGEIAALRERVASLEEDLQRRAASPARAASETGAIHRERDPDGDLLLEVGFPDRDVRAYRARVDEIELQRLYLADRARREGWLESPRYATESSELFQQLRETRSEFGDEMYDWALYERQQPNRVRVTEVIQGSAAAEAGLQAGDVLTEYADQRILGTTDLRSLTARGDAGEWTELEVDRGGERLRIYVPRGPLGVRIEPLRMRPDPPRR